MAGMDHRSVLRLGRVLQARYPRHPPALRRVVGVRAAGADCGTDRQDRAGGHHDADESDGPLLHDSPRPLRDCQRPCRQLLGLWRTKARQGRQHDHHWLCSRDELLLRFSDVPHEELVALHFYGRRGSHCYAQACDSLRMHLLAAGRSGSSAGRRHARMRAAASCCCDHFPVLLRHFGALQYCGGRLAWLGLDWTIHRPHDHWRSGGGPLFDMDILLGLEGSF
mmetsp:Transcript_15612/g.61018  ORF Transcript_15612/g.61018 Transcript_15612/m.61018 type:complete len:223 (+) Transcript_15612:523-1191(+)